MFTIRRPLKCNFRVTIASIAKTCQAYLEQEAFVDILKDSAAPKHHLIIILNIFIIQITNCTYLPVVNRSFFHFT